MRTEWRISFREVISECAANNLWGIETLAKKDCGVGEPHQGNSPDGVGGYRTCQCVKC